MTRILNYPLLILALSFFLLWLSARVGIFLRKLRSPLDEGEREDFSVVIAATLTLLGLIIGFTFSMASSRYDQRKNFEEAEANAIGTEYVRADLLPPADAARLRALLKTYLDRRIAFYHVRDVTQLRDLNFTTSELESGLWAAARTPAQAQPSALTSLVVTGMNDVLNSQGYTQAAWWNRIPAAAWCLMIVIAICCNVLVGYGARRTNTKSLILIVLPLIVSVSFFLIADIDSPRGGVIRVTPQNLVSLSESLHTQ